MVRLDTTRCLNPCDWNNWYAGQWLTHKPFNVFVTLQPNDQSRDLSRVRSHNYLGCFLGAACQQPDAEFAYVLVVLVVAAKWGLAESFLTSVAAMLCLNYFFLPPILSLTIADPQNWVALFAFLVTAITASKLSSIARQRADEAQAPRIEVEHLYQFSGR
jgi:K+-sensing histidine kinase KdpD